MTREEALDELLKTERQIDTLALRRKELRAIVLTQTYEATTPTRPHRTSAKPGESGIVVVKILREHEEPLTASELATLAEINPNAMSQRLLVLLKQGFVRRIGAGSCIDPYKWELAVHADANGDGK